MPEDISLKEIKEAVDAQGTAFEEFKTANDERLAEIVKTGSADPILIEKVDKLSATLDKHEDLNQQFTKLVETQKTVEDARKEAEAKLEGRLDGFETVLKRTPRGDSAEDQKDALKKLVNAWSRAVVKAFAFGVPNLSEDEQKALAHGSDEKKALVISDDTTGGYLAPPEFSREIIKTITEQSPIRTIARVRPTAMRSLQIPKRTTQFAAQWVAEAGTRSETTGLTFGLEEIPNHELYALIDLSEQNLEDSEFDLESFIREEATEQFAVAEGAAFVSGNAVGKPQGFMTNADVGEEVSGSSDSIADTDGQADGLIDLYHGVKTPYARVGIWTLNRKTLGAVRKLKDNQKNYIWQPGIASLRPSTILDSPYLETPDMADEGANNYPIAFGDFRRAYTIVDRIQMAILRDPFTQATSGNIRFIFRRRVGGQVVLAEAIRKLKCST